MRERTMGLGCGVAVALLAACCVLLAPGVARATSSSAYVTQNGGANVSQFDISAGGLLSPKTPSTVASGSSPEPVLLSPDGTSAYVGNDSSINISQFDVGAGGLLSPKTPATAPVPSGGSSPRGGAVSPDEVVP